MISLESVAMMTSSSKSRAADCLVDPANQQFSGNLAQRFARQPGGGETGGDDGDASHGRWLPMIYTSGQERMLGWMEDGQASA